MSQMTRGSTDYRTFEAALGLGGTGRTGNSKGENHTR
jgi:hypothetical protein